MKKIFYWVEIPAVDFDRAVTFYSKLLGVKFECIDCGTEMMACLPDDAGAIFWAPDFKPSKDGVLVSMNAGNDLDGWVERVKAYVEPLIVQSAKSKLKVVVGLPCLLTQKATDSDCTENKRLFLPILSRRMAGLAFYVHIFVFSLASPVSEVLITTPALALSNPIGRISPLTPYSNL